MEKMDGCRVKQPIDGSKRQAGGEVDAERHEAHPFDTVKLQSHMHRTEIGIGPLADIGYLPLRLASNSRRQACI